MIARNFETRIIKLETLRQRPNEILLIWRQPGQPVKEAVAKADFASGDRIMCNEWFGDDPFPAPRWHGERLSRDLPKEQSDYIFRSMSRIVKRESIEDPDFVRPVFQATRLVEMTDNDLLYCVFGVAT